MSNSFITSFVSKPKSAVTWKFKAQKVQNHDKNNINCFSNKHLWSTRAIYIFLKCCIVINSRNVIKIEKNNQFKSNLGFLCDSTLLL